MLNCFKKNKPPKEVLVANLDYDKFAAAIVKAQQAANEESFEKDNTAYFAKTLLQWAFSAVTIFLVVAFCCGFYMIFTESYSISHRILYGVVATMFLPCAYITFRMAKDIGRIKDRNYMVSFFSALVAMTALIVAIVKN